MGNEAFTSTQIEARRRVVMQNFENVLRKILLNETKPEYTQAQLEWEFDLPWTELEPLLKKNCEFQTAENKIKILSHRPSERESGNPDADVSAVNLRKLEQIFTGSKGEYISRKIRGKWSWQEEKILEWGYKNGLLYTEDDSIKMLSHVRPTQKKYV